jgi:hypothetical protein
MILSDHFIQRAKEKKKGKKEENLNVTPLLSIRTPATASVGFLFSDGEGNKDHESRSRDWIQGIIHEPCIYCQVISQ